MGITKAADLTNSVVTKYEKKYYLTSVDNPGVWAQFIDWQAPITPNGGNGSSLDFPIYSEQDLVEDSLTEDADVTPDTISDGNVTVTPDEYGKTFAISKKSRLQSRTNLDEVMGKLVAMNRVKSIDRILRRSACGRGSSYPTQTLHIDGSADMSDLTAASGTDTVTYSFLMELAAQAYSMDIEPFEDAGFLALVHPLVAHDLKALAEWKNIGYYQDKMNIYGALEKPFTLSGITFVPTNMGRLYMGSGTALQSATTLSAAASKGATTVTVTSATGLAVGNYITIGTLETNSVAPGANLEQVMITAVNDTTLTIRANGANDSFGLRFNHASGESVVEAYNVGAIPLIGKNSLIGVYSSDAGQYGVPIVTDGTLDTLKRMKYYGWWWYGGVGAIQKRVMLGKVAVSKWTIGIN